MMDGMVVAVLEQGFPHSLTFMVLEPVSHIQWHYEVRDDKLNPIENRKEKEFFVKSCKVMLEGGLWFNQTLSSSEGLPATPKDIVRDLTQLGYQKQTGVYENQDTVELWQGNLKALDQDLIYQR